jgi:hypothetical protein
MSKASRRSPSDVRNTGRTSTSHGNLRVNDLGPEIPGLDDLQVSIVKERHGFFVWSHLFSLTLAFAAGILIHVVASMSVFGTNILVGETPKIILLSMATLCLGFGAATLLNWRIRDVQWSKLEAKYETLDARAKELVDEIDRRDARTTSPRSS